MENQYSLLDALEWAVDAYPDNTAFRCGDESFTYGEFRERVARVAAGLAGLGLAPGDRVAVLSDNCHRFVELYWIAAQTGAILVPLGTRLSEEEMKHILEETSPKVLAADQGERQELLQRLYPTAPHFVGLHDGMSDCVPYEALAREEATPTEMTSCTPENPIAIFYTAATEGEPQGAVVTHRNWLTQAVQTGARLDTGPEDVYGAFLPLYHAFEGYMTLVSVCHGATTVVMPTFEAAEAVRLIGEHGITYFTEFAPMAEQILDAGGMDLFSSLEHVVGIDLPPTINSYVEQGVRWYTLYGQAEVSGIAIMGEIAPGGEARENLAGRPLALTRVSLRDASGASVPQGESGEAWLRGEAVVERYWPDRPTRLTEDGWLRSGDLLLRDEAGEFWFMGRAEDKALIKPGGENVYPAEVERVLLEHPAVAQVCVFGVPDPTWKEAVRAVVVPEGDQEPTSDELRSFCEGEIARFKCPKVVIFAEELPQAEGGQVDRNAVQEKYGE